jgi:hypothetical protein
VTDTGKTAGARFTAAIAGIDAVNAEDPSSEDHDGGSSPAALLYGQRMSAWLLRIEPDASEVLRLAARAQHIARWRIPRSDFPEGREGYLAWRARLAVFHGETAGAVLRDAGYDEDAVARLKVLLQKRGLKRDAEIQALEDAACLVFLENYFAAFAAKHPDDKVIDILKKTAAKMSPRGLSAAAGLVAHLPLQAQALVSQALGGSPRGRSA